jgi:hypothetical protein
MRSNLFVKFKFDNNDYQIPISNNDNYLSELLQLGRNYYMKCPRAELHTNRAINMGEAQKPLPKLIWKAKNS